MNAQKLDLKDANVVNSHFTDITLQEGKSSWRITDPARKLYRAKPVKFWRF